MIKNYDITDEFSYLGGRNYYFPGISELSLSKLKNHPAVKSIKKAYFLNGVLKENDSLVTGVRDFSVFPHNKNFKWNNSYFGPIVIPKKGVKVEINLNNLALYKRLIEVYENNSLEIINGKILINNIVDRNRGIFNVLIKCKVLIRFSGKSIEYKKRNEEKERF